MHLDPSILTRSVAAHKRERSAERGKGLIRSGRAAIRILTLSHLALLGLIALANAAGPERWWPSTLNLYLPQWMWGVPALLLLPACALWLRRWAWLPVLALVWVAGPLMGFCWGGANAPPGAPLLRVMTYNVKWGRDGTGEIVREIADARPDLLMLQDTGRTMEGPVGQYLRSWNVRTFGQYVIASRLPLGKAQVRWISFPGAPHTSLRCELTLAGARVALLDAHLLTPREGLTAVKDEAAEGGISELELNAADRLVEARKLADAVRREQGPVILCGDLNAPPPSLVCRTLEQAGLHDAFAEGGRGYGYTYGHNLRLAHSYTRIDHIYLSRGLRSLRCWTGGSRGSDHRPVVADIALSPGP